MATRVTQAALEVLTSPTVGVRVTQAALEVLASSSPHARVTQASLEVLTTGNPNARVTQAALEVLVLSASVMRVTQMGIESVTHTTSNVRVTQMGIESVIQTTSSARITQMGIEIVSPPRLRLIPVQSRLANRLSRSITTLGTFRGTQSRTIFTVRASFLAIRQRPIAVRSVIRQSFTHSVPARAVIGSKSRSFPANAVMSTRARSRSIPARGNIGNILRQIPARAQFENSTQGRFFPAIAEIGYRRYVPVHARFLGFPARAIPAFTQLASMGRIPAHAAFWNNTADWTLVSDGQTRMINLASRIVGGSIGHTFDGWPSGGDAALPSGWDQPFYDDSFWQPPLIGTNSFFPFPLDTFDPSARAMDFNWGWPNPTDDYASNFAVIGPHPVTDPWSAPDVFRRKFGLPNSQAAVDATSGTILVGIAGSLFVDEVNIVRINGFDLPQTGSAAGPYPSNVHAYAIPSYVLRPGTNVLAFMTSTFIVTGLFGRSSYFKMTFHYRPAIGAGPLVMG